MNRNTTLLSAAIRAITHAGACIPIGKRPSRSIVEGITYTATAALSGNTHVYHFLRGANPPDDNTSSRRGSAGQVFAESCNKGKPERYAEMNTNESAQNERGLEKMLPANCRCPVNGENGTVEANLSRGESGDEVYFSVATQLFPIIPRMKNGPTSTEGNQAK